MSGEAEEEKGKKKNKLHNPVPHCLEEIACLGPASDVPLSEPGLVTPRFDGKRKKNLNPAFTISNCVWQVP